MVLYESRFLLQASKTKTPHLRKGECTGFNDEGDYEFDYESVFTPLSERHSGHVVLASRGRADALSVRI
jgi:hypothetical protein